jgi:hypothetical protein
MKMDCFVALLLAMTSNPDMTLRSRRMNCARFAINIPPKKSEGAGNAGRSMRPQPRV